MSFRQPRRWWFRVAVAALACGVAVLGACREPTEITVALSTDLPCSQLSRTSIYVGTPAELQRPLGELALSAEATTCDPTTKTIGTIAVIPAGARTDTVGLRVVARLTGSDCDRDAKSGCIDVRRTIGFIEHRSLRLPIALDAACRDVVCSNASDTCYRGQCVTAVVDPNACASGTCGELGGDAGTDGGIDGGSDGGTCGPLLSAVTYVWHFEDPADTVQESNGALPPVSLTVGSTLAPGLAGCGRALVRQGASAPLQLASSTVALQAQSFSLAFRFKTKAQSFVVTNQGTTGWRVGLTNGSPSFVSCIANCAVSTDPSLKLADDQWHWMSFEALSTGTRVLIDGKLNSVIAPTQFPPKPDGFLAIEGDGAIDDLTFKAN